jgi:hypothetical protein
MFGGIRLGTDGVGGQWRRDNKFTSDCSCFPRVFTGVELYTHLELPPLMREKEI